MRRIAIALLLVILAGDVSAQTRRRAVRHPAPAVPSPLAAADSYSLSQGDMLTIADPGVLANDTLHDAALASFGPHTGTEETALGRTVQTAEGGSLSLSAGGGFTYTPASAFTGTDAFHYVIANAGGSASAAVTFVVSATEASAAGDSYTTEPDSTLAVPPPGVLTNDRLGGGRLVSFGAATGAEQSIPGTSRTNRGGTVSLDQDGGFTYLPPPGTDDGYGYQIPFTGDDSFYYRIQLGSAFSTARVGVLVDVPSSGADYVVTTPGHYYAISGLSGENPVLELQRGKIYRFQIEASPAHPFAILDAPAGSVTNNNITHGTLTFAVPMTAASYRYRCTTHLFGNGINTVP